MARNQSSQHHANLPCPSVALQPRPLLADAAHAANDNQRLAPGVRPDSALPPDARAVIEPVERSATQSPPVRTGKWRLRFIARSPYHVDPLTGWTGGSDPLRHVEISFPSREAAIAYARRQGLDFAVREPPARRPFIHGPLYAAEGPIRLCCWPTGPHALCCGRYPVETNEAEHARSA